MAKTRGRPPEGQYRTTGSYKVPKEITEMATRRTRPFLDSVGIDARPLGHVLNEVYLQGMKDAVDVLSEQKG